MEEQPSDEYSTLSVPPQMEERKAMQEYMDGFEQMLKWAQQGTQTKELERATKQPKASVPSMGSVIDLDQPRALDNHNFTRLAEVCVSCYVTVLCMQWVYGRG